MIAVATRRGAFTAWTVATGAEFVRVIVTVAGSDVSAPSLAVKVSVSVPVWPTFDV